MARVGRIGKSVLRSAAVEFRSLPAFRGQFFRLPPFAFPRYNEWMATETTDQSGEESIDLKDPVLAAFLAWLMPGLGHWYQGRRAKAALYFICIMGLFAYGLYLSSSNEKCRDSNGTIGYGRAVYFSWRPDDQRLAYLCQIGVGLPALPALVQANRMANHRKVWWGGFMAPPWPSAANREAARAADDPNADQPTAGELQYQLNHYFDLAGFFTMVAGLLNVLVIYDALAGPVVVPLPDKKKEKEGDEETKTSAPTL